MEFIFDHPLYQAARESRLRNLWRHLDVRGLAGKRILELGCGTGELGQAFVEAGCRVVSIDGRQEYVEELRRRYAGREASTLDVEHWDPSRLGSFDAVLCFGLLYHLSKPQEFLTACSMVAPELYLETVVSDSDAPICPVVTEEGPDQAFSGRGCRPSPAWLATVLQGLGYSVCDISSEDSNWMGACPSVFNWKPRNNGEWMRDGSLLRKMLVCRRPSPSSQ